MGTRGALAVLDVSRRVNGLVLAVDNVEAYEFLSGRFVRRELDLAGVDAWLRPRVR